MCNLDIPTTTLERCLIAFNEASVDGEVVLYCCNVFGNTSGDYTYSIESQYGINGIICEDPLFCELANDEFTLDSDSPCAPFSDPNPECDLIGAWPVGCGSTPTTSVTWGAVKALFR